MWLSLLISFGVYIVKRFGVPYLEKKYPMLKPLLEEILLIVGGKSEGSTELHECAGKYCEMKQPKI